MRATSTSRPIKPEAVEVTFRVHPSVRVVEERLYCSAEPAQKDHIRVMTLVQPGETKTIKPHLAPGRYKVWSGHRGGWYLDIEEGASRELRYEAHPEGTVVKAGIDPTVTYVNDGAERRDVLDRARDLERRRVTSGDAAVVPGVPRSVQRGLHRRRRQARGRRADAAVHGCRRLDRVLRDARRSGGVRRDQEALRRGVPDRRRQPRRGRQDDRRCRHGDVLEPDRCGARVAPDPRGVPSERAPTRRSGCGSRSTPDRASRCA